MKIGDKCTLTTPWHDTPQEGTIIDVFKTDVGTCYYVVAFADGTKWTAKEGDLLNRPSDAVQRLLNRSNEERKDFCVGYIHALYVEHIIGKTEFEYYNNVFQNKI